MRRPERVKLTIDDFLLLRGAGVFSAFSKSELLEGELFGVLAQPDDEPESDAIVPIKLRIRDYLLLDEAGAFAAHRKTELIDGVVYEVSPQHRPHGFVKDELAYRLRRALDGLASPLHVATEQSVEIAPYNDPLPDIILTSEPRGPGGIPVQSVSLIVEVADTSARFDLSAKAELYALAGIAEYWVADVKARVIHQLWRPDGQAYSEQTQVPFGQKIAAATVEELAVETKGL